MRRILYITSFIVILLVSFLGITYSYEYNGIESLTFELIGPSTLYMDVNTEYKEYGVKVINNGVDISSSVKIDSSLVNVNLLGEYKVKYEIDINGNKEYVYRDVKVIDNTEPQIILNGDEIVYVILNGSYYEYGYTVSDNYDLDLDKKVSIRGKVNTSKVGKYELLYSVVDSSGNIGSAKRIVIVKEPEITLADVSGNRYTLSSYNVTKYSNTVVKNKWVDNGIYYEGYVRDNTNNYKIKLKNKDNSLEYIYELSFSKSNYYNGIIDLSIIPNGTYDVYVIGTGEYKLLNKMDGLSRIYKARVLDKLVSISYNDDIVNLIIDDFKYEYDILIDPGHGGFDSGAANGFVYEKDMNLKQSLYEKCRYESMGLKVYMTRYEDVWGQMMGTSKLDNLQRKALTVGYYGAVSKVSYSNHHNASESYWDHGFEIIVSNNLSLDDLSIEISLYNKYKKFYGLSDNNIRLYSRDYNTSVAYSKLYGNIYSIIDLYAIIRIPDELFNVKNIIYEPIYISNMNDFNWYWNNKKWIDVSEIKIEEYVNYIGGNYNKDNSMCLKYT